MVVAVAGTLSIANPSQFGPGPFRYTPVGAAGAAAAMFIAAVGTTDKAAALVGGGAGHAALLLAAIALVDSAPRLNKPASRQRPNVRNERMWCDTATQLPVARVSDSAEPPLWSASHLLCERHHTLQTIDASRRVVE